MWLSGSVSILANLSAYLKRHILVYSTCTVFRENGTSSKVLEDHPNSIGQIGPYPQGGRPGEAFQTFPDGWDGWFLHRKTREDRLNSDRFFTNDCDM
jgi:16S rRNA C967 or C1407 C5-methylase (RsmB/RsmF family)